MSVRRVLAIDDEQGIREGCRRVLTSEGYQVDTAADGLSGLEMFRSDPYDLVLVDLRMPGMTGMQLLGELRKHDPDVVAIVITAYASLDTAVEATKRGAYDYLAKPFTPEELTAVVGRAWGHRCLLVEAQRLRQQREHDLLALAGEQSRLRTIVDCMADGLLVINRDRQLVLYNPAALRLLREVELSVGCLISECVQSEDLVSLMEAALPPEAPARTSRELSIGDGDDESVVLVTTARVVDEAGDGLGVVAMIRDVTDLKEIERVKASFVNMVSHELRAPLSAIRGYLDVILEGFAGDDPDRQHNMLARMRARTDALLTLVDDLLTVSRLDRRHVSRTLEPVPVDDLIAEVTQLFAAEAEKHQVTLRHAPDSNALTVMADREELQQVVTNLVSNAIKYNRPGGEVRVGLDAVGDHVRLTVSDTGLGISADAIRSLGREFYRVKTPETRDITGTGLGLSVVKRILAAHQGRLEVESEQGKGSTFRALLPRVVVGHP